MNRAFAIKSYILAVVLTTAVPMMGWAEDDKGVGWYVQLAGNRTALEPTSNVETQYTQSCGLTGCETVTAEREYDVDYDTASHVSIGVGYDYGNRFRTVLELYNFDAEVDKVQGGATTASTAEEVSAKGFSVDGWYDVYDVEFQGLGTLTPYVGGGLGGAKVKFGSAEDVIPTLKLGLGVTWALPFRLTVDVGYRWTLGEDSDYESDDKSLLIESDYEEATFAVALRYAFYER